MNANTQNLGKGLYTEARGVVSLRNRSFEQMLEKILEDLLERKGIIWSFLGERVVIPEGELVAKCDGPQCFYSTGFEVYNIAGRRVLFGRVGGTMTPLIENIYKVKDLEIYSLH
ncbi:MAG: hypothetical protein ACP5QE_08030 [Conexivisphaera sp.]